MKDDMKLCEVRLDENGFRFRYANPRPLTAEQKTKIALAAIGMAAFLGFLLIISCAVR